MKCPKARQIIPLLDQGGLSPRSDEALAAHLEGCQACRALKAEQEETMRLLSEYQSPPLPEGFGAMLRARLELEATGPRKMDTHPLPALEEEPRPRRILRAMSFLAAGLLLGALATWGIQRAMVARSPSPERPSEERAQARLAPEQTTLTLGQVAVVTISLEARTEHPDAELEVVLPDGLSLVGEGLAELEEKVLRWAEPLQPGINLIRVPVKAIRPGYWQLVARAHSNGKELGASSRLEVTES